MVLVGLMLGLFLINKKALSCVAEGLMIKLVAPTGVEPVTLGL